MYQINRLSQEGGSTMKGKN